MVHDLLRDLPFAILYWLCAITGGPRYLSRDLPYAQNGLRAIDGGPRYLSHDLPNAQNGLRAIAGGPRSLAQPTFCPFRIGFVP